MNVMTVIVIKKNFTVHIISLMSLKVEGKLDLCSLNLPFH